jgi:membrane glycosyltransferase
MLLKAEPIMPISLGDPNTHKLQWAPKTLSRRRWLFAFLVITTVLLLAAWLGSIVAGDGLILINALIIAAFSIKASWVALMFWNAVLGIAVLHGGQKTRTDIGPPTAKAPDGTPNASRCAVTMTVRNEAVTAVIARLSVIKAHLDAAEHGYAFDYFLLSDSSEADVIAAEERGVEAWRTRSPDGGKIVYRRRTTNEGAQHGNLRDFCERWGSDYEIMVVLDADSLMSAPAIVRLVRTAQANPNVGMLQSLNIGILPASLFARVFEFGHRHAMRCQAAGAAWWQAERGQYRGHNAAIRVEPYAKHCRLADLPGKEPFGGITFCHDQIEGALMHRAGYAICELPEEDEAYEGLPPTILDFTTRYDRWFQGNLTNLKVLWLPGLTAMDRYHLFAVVHRFLGWPAFVLFVVLAAYLVSSWPASAVFPTASALTLYATYFALYFAPRMLGVIDAAWRARMQYGGISTLLAGAMLDIVFTILFVPIAMISGTYFLIGRAFGYKLAWTTQRRDPYRLTWADALRALWPQMLFGFALLTYVAVTSWGAVLWFLPFILGLIFCVPFSVISAAPARGAQVDRWRICAMPEEIKMPREIASILEFEATNGKPVR